jgi:hypothetical protein
MGRGRRCSWPLNRDPLAAHGAHRSNVKPIKNPQVAAVFESYPPKFRRKLLALRALIFETAASIEGVGAIEETLKWGEPAYVTSETKSGSTIRIDWKASAPREYSLYFHCQTTLVADFRQQFPQEFEFDGNRRIVFGENDRIPKGPLSRCIAAALTYHRDKRGSALEARARS